MLPDQGKVFYLRTRLDPDFTVDVDVAYVSWNAIAAPIEFVDAATLDEVYAGDNVFIESLEVTYPYQFGQGPVGDVDNLMSIWLEIGWQSTGVQANTVNELGFDGQVWIPNPNIEYPIQVPVRYPCTDGLNWGFFLNDGGGTVSMINAPAILDEEDLHIAVFMKVRSTYVMQ